MVGARAAERGAASGSRIGGRIDGWIGGRIGGRIGSDRMRGATLGGALAEGSAPVPP
ncbi:MAG TPA: hypothetical protein VFT22_09610 [Kofleriaceae bacterium]|nr:hypothetical protein [Kofleriaceae bacterium]